MSVLNDQTKRNPDWVSKLRHLHDNELLIDWESHLGSVNDQFGFSGEQTLSTAQEGAPLAWFNGDVEAVEGTDWALVISLNPQKPPEGYYRVELTPATAWSFRRTHNAEFWYIQFFRPLVYLTALSFGESVPSYGDAEKAFATKRMVFVELCPYASRKFTMTKSELLELNRNDIGFQIAGRVRQLLLNEGQPSLILINGGSAVDDFEVIGGDRLSWERYDYQIETKTGSPKDIWHMGDATKRPAR